jgi:hypothetical protein
MPGTILSASGMFVEPERCMSSCVTTAMAAGDCPMVLSCLETDVTGTLINSSRDIFLNLV